MHESRKPVAEMARMVLAASSERTDIALVRNEGGWLQLLSVSLGKRADLAHR
jgi:hypothetical protein